jgi:hypothetical protein
LETAIFAALNQARRDLKTPVAEFRIVPNFVSGGFMALLCNTFEIDRVQFDVILARRTFRDEETFQQNALQAMKSAQAHFNRLTCIGAKPVSKPKTIKTP